MATIPIALVMPVYNESAGLERMLNEWRHAVLNAISGCVLIAVDDGSTDGSGALLDRIAAEDARIIALHQPNAGHGPAIVNGYREALRRGAEWIFQTDSDAQFRPEDFGSGWAMRAGASAVIGCRQNRPDPLVRRIGARVERGLVRWLFGVRLPDPNCAFRFVRADVMRRALDLIDPADFAPNVALSVVAGLLYKEGFRSFPVRCLPRPYGESTLHLRAYARGTFRTLRQLLRFRRRLRAAASVPAGA